MAISGIVGAFYVQSSTPVAMIDQPCTPVYGYTTYEIIDVNKRYLDLDASITVKKNSVTVSSGYTIEYAGGRIVFDTPLIGTDVVTVSGNYLPMTQSAGCFGWKIDIEVDMSDVTTFNSNGNKEYIPTISGYSASAESYWIDSNFYNNIGDRIACIFYVNDTSDTRYEGYAIVNKDSIEDTVDDIVNETIELQGIGLIYFRES